ncbi:MAG: glycosyltransferase family 39 protein [Rhodanobacter sp.]|nr:glycosyltransferase family 39 protein [Rhodanobacter sp.]
MSKETTIPGNSLPLPADTRRGSTIATRRSLLAILLLGLLLGFAFQGTRGLWSPDEGRYVGGALQMLDTGDWLAPAFSAGELNFSKPPLTYWAIAASFEIFGRNTWASRVPYALAFVATLLLLYGMGRVLVAERPWLPALICACMPFPFFAANIVSTDVFLCVFEALAMLGFLRATFGTDPAQGHRWIVLMWLGFGLAFLTKGPPGLIPLLAILPFVQRHDGWQGLRRLFAPAGVIVFLVVGCTWYVLVMLRYPWLPHYFLHREVYDRMFTAVQRRHPGPFGWFVVYAPTLVLGSLPWWPMLLGPKARAALAADWREARSRHYGPELFLLLWLTLPLLVFCLVQSRLPLYVLPLFLPLSLLLALALRRRITLRGTTQRLAVGLWLVALLAVKAGAGWMAHPVTDNLAAAQQLAAKSEGNAYSSIVFVENTGKDYELQEQTPWGLRLYLDRPVYGVAWHEAQAASTLCNVARTNSPALLVLDPAIQPEAVESTLAGCGLERSVRLGDWRRNVLILARGRTTP